MLTQIFLNGCFLLSLISCVCFAQQMRQPKNISGLTISGPGEGSEREQSVCRGKLSAKIDLSQVGLKDSDLENGVRCLATDLQGLGYLDFVLFGPEKKDKFRRIDLLIIYFDGKYPVRTQVVRDSVEILTVFKFDDRERPKYPKYKDVPGLIFHAGGDLGWVYFYDKKTKELKEENYVYPPGDD